MKTLKYFLAAALSIILSFTGMQSAFAQPPAKTPAPQTALGITSVYTKKDLQEQKAQVFRDTLKYNVAVPFAISGEINLPPKREEFDKTYVPSLVAKLGDGSVTEAWFDFQNLKAETVGNRFFSATAPQGERLYSVVAGQLPNPQQCPVEIQDTQIAFFRTEKAATAQAKELDRQGYLVYVSPDVTLRKKVLDALYDNYSQQNKNASCFVVDGATQKITVNLAEIAELLPDELQAPAKNKPFVFQPESGSLYVVNARKTA